ncbi:hypothetical protein KAU32_02320 [bacterium]|nr:hypothetical protein [bacterium]
MVSLREKVSVEMENISLVLEELEKVKDKPNKTPVELAGMGAFLHNIYNGIENILKQILNSQSIQISDSDSWHRDLLLQATDEGIITDIIKKELAKYLAFRHFFIHAYEFLLDEKKLRLLVDNAFNVYLSFKTEIDSFLAK